MRRNGISLAVIMSVPLIAFGACNRQQDREAMTTDTPSVASRPVEQQTDTSLTTAVQARLYANQTFRGQDINVRVENGVATLSGTVDSEAVEQQALATVRGVEGIVRVEDELMVEQGQVADRQDPDRARGTAGFDELNPAWITTKIQAQYFAEPDVKPWEIDVTTSAGGIVELRGDVESQQAKSEALRIAQSTEGVTRVEDHLRVRSTDAPAGTAERPAEPGEGAGDTAATADADTSDPWLTAKIQSKYFLDPDVKGRDIDVTARNGVVTLQGMVENERERRQAVAIANNTDGVVQVQDDLQVQPAGRDAAAPDRTAVDAVEDTWITTKIQSKYFLDQEVKGHEINVDTRNGVVTLTGSVESEAARRLAEAIARETDGVNRVVNQLTVSSQGQG